MTGLKLAYLLGAAGLLAAALVALRVALEPSPSPVAPSSFTPQAAPVPLVAAQSEPPAADSAQHPPGRGMHTELLEMQEGTRNLVFRLTVRDAGFPCASIMESAYIGAAKPLWRIACSEALYYTVGINEQQRLVVEPLSLGGPQGPWIGKRTLELIEPEPRPNDE